ncbi:CCE_0567 family metalloprotein [Motiliproteus sp. SC1-56]|uniref:CCE_0567 family metalloprotein n=1 Tax=Motiliproteus sp. SC1-56 TaxID=2799565 RepID=UPI001A904918|nr:CCE_0567 family metalloprotein [Motiliproteus sp. SC1-56]
MNDISTLEKEVKKRKRIAGEWAMQLHDLAEERLPAAFEELPAVAESTYRACQAWREAARALKEAKG